MDPSESLFRACVLLNTLAAAARDRVLASLPIDAIVVIPGVGEKERIDGGVALAQRAVAWVLHLAPISPPERARGDMPSHEDVAGRLAQARHVPELHIGGDATHTHDQARKVMAFLEQRSRITDARMTVYLVTTDWHLPRAYLTLVSVLLGWYGPTPLPRVYPWSAARAINGTVHGARPGHYAGHTLSDAIGGEYARMLEYQRKGDVATLDELMLYLRRAALLEDGSP